MRHYRPLTEAYSVGKDEIRGEKAMRRFASMLLLDGVSLLGAADT